MRTPRASDRNRFTACRAPDQRANRPLMRWMGSFCSLVILVVASCSRPSGPMLHRLPEFAGDVQITPDDAEQASPQRADVAFSRFNGNMQARYETGKRVVSLLRNADGSFSAFEDAVERSPTAEEAARFQLVVDLCDPNAIEAIEASEKTYRARRKGVWYRVELTRRSGFHSGHSEPK